MEADEKKKNDALKLLVEAQGELVAFLRALMPFNRGDVQEVAQMTNRAVVEHIAEYNPARPFVVWLFGFARRQLCVWRRKNNSRLVSFDSILAEQAAEFLTEGFVEEGPDDARLGLWQRLAACREKLSPKQETLLKLRYECEMPVAEIAEKLSRTEKQVRHELDYVRGKLAACLRGTCKVHGNFAEEKIGRWIVHGMLLPEKRKRVRHSFRWIASVAASGLVLISLAATVMPKEKATTRTQELQTASERKKEVVRMEGKTLAAIASAAAIVGTGSLPVTEGTAKIALNTTSTTQAVQKTDLVTTQSAQGSTVLGKLDTNPPKGTVVILRGE